MNKYENTLTYNNLKRAYEGESAEHTKYLLYSRTAEKEGFPEFADYFKRTANEKLGQAGVWLGELEPYGSTEQNLRRAADSEAERQKVLKKAASDAANEGFDELSERFLLTANVSDNHSLNNNRYLEYLGRRNAPTTEEIYRCDNCGCEQKGLRPPEICPLCGYPERYFRMDYR